MRYHELIVDDYDQGRTVIYPAFHAAERIDGYDVVHVFGDDELDELARCLYAAAHGGVIEELDDNEWRHLVEILRNHRP